MPGRAGIVGFSTLTGGVASSFSRLSFSLYASLYMAPVLGGRVVAKTLFLGLLSFSLSSSAFLSVLLVGVVT